MERRTRQRDAIWGAFERAGRPLSPQEVLGLAQADVPGLAIAPVFLISGAGGILAAMAVRYGRAIDRAREALHACRAGEADDVDRKMAEEELRVHYRRAHLLRITIITNVLSIFAVSLCILV